MHLTGKPAWKASAQGKEGMSWRSAGVSSGGGWGNDGGGGGGGRMDVPHTPLHCLPYM